MATEAQEAESVLLNRIKVARGNAEPQQEPTKEPEAVDVSEEEAPEEVETEEVQEELNLDAEVETEAEELVSEEADTAPVEDQEEELYVEFKGRSISFSQIEEWEQGSMMQADYTRKTQATAQDRKEIAAEREANKALRVELESSLATVNAILSEETLSAEKLAEMREDDPEGFINYGEKLGKRKSAVAKAKVANFDIAAENQKLFDAHPSWIEDGKVTEECTKAMKAIGDFAIESGQYTVAEVNAGMRSRDILNLHNTIKLNARSTKNAALEKKVRKAPVTTRPKAGTKANVKSALQKAQARLKQTGKPEDAVAVRKLKRQLQG